MILYLFTIRRSNANLTYTAKLLDGYHMHSQTCSECDMPMMKYEDSVSCVICPPKVKEVARSVNVTIVESPKEEQVRLLCSSFPSLKAVSENHHHPFT